MPFLQYPIDGSAPLMSRYFWRMTEEVISSFID